MLSMKKLAMGATVIAASTFALTGCVEGSNRSEGKKEQENVMDVARSAVPTYQPSNFLSREAVRKAMERMDTPNKTFYIYLLGNNGNHIGYYVAQTRPVCYSTLMTPPDQTVGGQSRAVVSAPSLDGVYSGGECHTHFFFDAETDAYIEIKGLNFFTSDQPLNVDSEALNVKTQ